MKITSVAVVLATAGIATADLHARHAHFHHHKRDAVTAAAPQPTVLVYELGGQVIPAEQACNGIANGSLKWANGIAPSEACDTSSVVPSSTSTALPSTVASVTPAELLQQTASFSSASSSSTSSSTTTSSTSTTTSSSTSTSSSTTTSSTTTSSTTTSSTVASSSSTSTLSPVTTAVPSASSSAGPGGVTIVNNTPQEVYLWSVSNVPADMITIPPGGSYAENWRINPDGGGISVKVSTIPNLADVLQYEYTLSGSTIFWDLSCINMGINNLLSAVGFSVTSGNTNCVADMCPAGDLVCAAAYLFPSDNKATHGCPSNTQMVFQIGL